MGVKEETGASIEVLLLKRKEEKVWETLVKPGKKARVGARISFGDGLLVGEVIDIVEEGNRLIRFEYDGIFEEILDQLGQMPLPPYITHQLQDKNRYQTVYAKYDGSAAAPTAGLHFTEELLEKIQAKGIRIAKVTLHVGLGTFRPVKEENVLDHHMHSEFYIVDEEAARVINETRASGGRVISVGTTSTRTLETVAELNPEHISAYSLIIEEGTPFGDKEPENLPDEDTEYRMYDDTMEVLERYGYHKYEISNYARKGHECRHNVGYWRRTEYLGLGLGAASLYRGQRFSVTSDMEEYLRDSSIPEKIHRDVETLTRADQMEEFMFLGLRMMEGVSETEFQRQFGCAMDSIYGNILEKYRNEGFL